MPSQKVRLDPPNLNNSVSNHLLRRYDRIPRVGDLVEFAGLGDRGLEHTETCREASDQEAWQTEIWISGFSI